MYILGSQIKNTKQKNKQAKLIIRPILCLMVKQEIGMYKNSASRQLLLFWHLFDTNHKICCGIAKSEKQTKQTKMGL